MQGPAVGDVCPSARGAPGTMAGRARGAGARPAVAVADLTTAMRARVTVMPSGHEFFAEGNDTLLEAALRAGLKLDYGCGNGTCGSCKARILSGETTQAMSFDHPLPERERQQGYALLCACSAASGEIVIETLEAQGPREIPEQEIAVRVRTVQQAGEDTLVLHVQTPRTARLRFLAGQSATLHVVPAEHGPRATYPIASCPCDDRDLRFHIGRSAADALGSMLFSGAIRPGETLLLRGPAGEFVLDGAGDALAFIACDTGIAPVRSLIEHAMAVDTYASISLDWLALRPDGHYLSGHFRAWAEALDGFRYAAHRAPSVREGAWQALAALQAARPLGDLDIYVAGPAEFIETTRAAAVAAGAAPGRLRLAAV